jgi:hypothetical protein
MTFVADPTRQVYGNWTFGYWTDTLNNPVQATMIYSGP